MTLQHHRLPRAAPGLWRILLGDGSHGRIAPGSNLLDLARPGTGRLAGVRDVHFLRIETGHRLLVLHRGVPVALPRVVSIVGERFDESPLDPAFFNPHERVLLVRLAVLDDGEFWPALHAAVNPTMSSTLIHHLTAEVVRRRGLPSDLRRLLDLPVVHRGTYDQLMLTATGDLRSFLRHWRKTPREHKVFLASP